MLHPRLNSELRRVPKGKNELSCAVLTERSNLPRRRQTLKQRLGILGRDGRSFDRMRLAVEVNHWRLTRVEAQASGALLDNQGEQIGHVALEVIFVFKSRMKADFRISVKDFSRSQ